VHTPVLLFVNLTKNSADKTGVLFLTIVLPIKVWSLPVRVQFLLRLVSAFNIVNVNESPTAALLPPNNASIAASSGII